MQRSAQSWLSRIATAFDRRGWRDENTALEIVSEVKRTGEYKPDSLEAVVPAGFLESNDITLDQLRAELATALEGWEIEVDRPALVPIEAIDTFAAVSEVASEHVAAISNPLDLPEETIKQFIAQIIGEPYIEGDWGGEASDLFSAQVIFGGHRIHAAFLLKGPGVTKGPMRPTNLGKRGDQGVRLFTQPADLYVIQHINQIDYTVVEMLRRFVLSARAEGNPNTVGSVWEGTDCARLFVAHGLIDLDPGKEEKNGPAGA